MRFHVARMALAVAATALCATACTITATTATPTPAYPASTGLEWNTNRAGSDYRSFESADAQPRDVPVELHERIRRASRSLTSIRACRGRTRVAGSRTPCPAPTPDTCCVSGDEVSGRAAPPRRRRRRRRRRVRRRRRHPPLRRRRRRLAGDADHATARAAPAAAARRRAGRGRRPRRRPPPPPPPSGGWRAGRRRRPRRPRAGSGSRRPDRPGSDYRSFDLRRAAPRALPRHLRARAAVPRMDVRASRRAGAERALLVEDRRAARAAGRLLPLGREVKRGG